MDKITRLTRRAGLRRRLAKNGLTLRGKNGNFSEKSDKKGSQNRVRLDHSPSEISQFFREFPGSLKFQDEMPGAGKRCVDGAYATRKNLKKSVWTDGQTDTSSWKYRVAEKEAPSAQKYKRYTTYNVCSLHDILSPPQL